MEFAAVEQALEEAAQRGVFPGAVLLVSRNGETLFERAVGKRSIDADSAPMRPEVVFDLSSLTKPLATTLAFFALADEGRVALDAPVAAAVPELAEHAKSAIIYRHLLAHSSGLPAHRRFFERVGGRGGAVESAHVGSDSARAMMFDLVHREPLESAPGARAVYSDLGFILLGEAIERLAATRLDRFCHERIYAPLGIDELTFFDLAAGVPSHRLPIAPTQRCPWRGRLLRGEVDDENAFAMGGIAGHAGLFGTARSVDALARALLRAWRSDGGILRRATVDAMWTVDATVPGSTRALGWDTPAPERSMAGARMSRHTVGHLGFTGTSLWIDLERSIGVVLLTNRVHPSREGNQMAEVRPRIHDLIMEAI